MGRGSFIAFSVLIHFLSACGGKLAALGVAGGRDGAVDTGIDVPTTHERGSGAGGEAAPHETLDAGTDGPREAEADAAIVCGQGLVSCGGVCASLRSDPNNCGVCGHACDSRAGAACDLGLCNVSGCSAGLTNCVGACVDTNTDPARCGSCAACPADFVCGGGMCICRAGTIPCTKTACVDTAVDPHNCGGCGITCSGATPVCKSGVCSIGCTPLLTNCGDSCIDTSSDDTNCGSCGTVCQNRTICVAGQCTCPLATVSCGGVCVDTSTDPYNCGSCGSICANRAACQRGRCVSSGCDSGLVQCGGSCVSTETDPQNCGRCGATCAAGYRCVGGQCTCPDGKTHCKYLCVNTDSDLANCGGCSIACTGGQVCAKGHCVRAPH